MNCKGGDCVHSGISYSTKRNSRAYNLIQHGVSRMDTVTRIFERKRASSGHHRKCLRSVRDGNHSLVYNCQLLGRAQRSSRILKALSKTVFLPASKSCFETPFLPHRYLGTTLVSKRTLLPTSEAFSRQRSSTRSEMIWWDRAKTPEIVRGLVCASFLESCLTSWTSTVLMLGSFTK